MLVKTEAIVLHAFKYGDRKIIVDMFTREHGRVAFVVTMANTGRGRLKKQYFQPLTLINIEYDQKPQAQLQKLHDVSLLTPLATLHGNPSKLAIALFMSEFLYHALKGEQHNSPLFDYLRSGIEWLDARRQQFANFHIVFLIHLSRFLGFYPNLDTYAHGSCFDLRAGTFSINPPLHRDQLLPQEAAQMVRLMRMDLPTMHLFRMNREQRNRLLQVAIQYYRLHLPDFPELRSLPVLHEVFEA